MLWTSQHFFWPSEFHKIPKSFWIAYIIMSQVPIRFDYILGLNLCSEIFLLWAQASWRIPKCCWYHLSNKTLELCCSETDNQNDSGLLPELSFQWNTGIILKVNCFVLLLHSTKQFTWFLYFIGMTILLQDRNRSDYQSQNSTIPMFYWKDDTNNI